MKRDEIHNLIDLERTRQDRIHPEWHGDNHGLVVLAEEFGEVAKALYEGDTQNLKEELVQVCAVCVRWLENMK